MKTFNAIIIGGGPIGLYAAYRLGGLFSTVALIERKGILDENNLCSGVVSNDFIERYQLPEDIVLSRYNRIEIRIKSHPVGELFVNIARIDRKKLKKYFLQHSKIAGCSVFEKENVTNIFFNKENKIIIEVNKGEKAFETDFLILACGNNTDLVQKLSKIDTVLKIWGSQQILPSKNTKRVQVNIGETDALFSWSIPVDSNKAIIGRLSYKEVNGKYCKYIPFLRPHKFSGKQFALLGLCGGQIKTTTAGVYSYGFWCVDKLYESIISSDCLTKAFEKFSFEIKGAIIDEFDFGILFWKLLKNNPINRLLFRARLFRNLRIIPNDNVQFDWHFNSFYKRFVTCGKMSIALKKCLSDLEIREVNCLTRQSTGYRKPDGFRCR